MSRDLIALLIFTLVTVVAWIGFDIYHNRTGTTLKGELQEQMRTLDPNFDLELIRELKDLERH